MHHRKSKRGLIYASVLAVSLVGLIGWRTSTARPAATATDGPRPQATVVRSPTCGCCGNFVAYLKQRGFDVETRFVEDSVQRRNEAGVPDELASCHTTLVGGYVVEGHVPVEAIDKLLKEKPDIKGIGMPGMPSGSPGMPGKKQGTWEIKSFNEDGSTGDFMSL